MVTALTFTLRPFGRQSPPISALEGAFRVHLSMKDLKTLGLTAGDLCRISSISGRSGFGVSWNATQTNPGNKPIAQVTDLFRETYGFSLEDRVIIEKATEPWRRIEKLHVTLADLGLAGFEDVEEFLFLAKTALMDLDLIVPGCTFDVQQKGPKCRQRGPKVRVSIDVVEPQPDHTGPLYFHRNSLISITDAPADERAAPIQSDPPQINREGIGGLNNQIDIINKKVAILHSGSAIAGPRSKLQGPTTFLIHGPEGTGKTMLLDRLSRGVWTEILILDQEWLPAGPKAQAQALREAFNKAKRAQPALIIMDALDKLLAKAETLIGCLRAELGKLEDAKVVIAAATRSIYDVDTSLLTKRMFNTKIEIFPPNSRQREAILRELLPDSELDIVALAERTHGFVGRDLDDLCVAAQEHNKEVVFDSTDRAALSAYVDALSRTATVTPADIDAVIETIQPSVLKDSVLEVPKVRWTDIAGLDHVRKQLEDIIVRPFKFPDLDLRFGGALSQKGILLYGPPGCAKTLIAQAVATESNQNFIAVKGSELIKMYVGESERAVRDIFRKARAAKPCVIFFDEIDSIGKSREKSQDSGLNVVATLLNEMDGIEALKDVFIIGATNRPDILDSALIRTGRFDAHVHIGLPNLEARKQILEIHTRGRPLGEDVDLSVVATKTEGSSGADLKGLCAVVVTLAISDWEMKPEGTQPDIRMEHFERALESHTPNTLKEDAERYRDWRPGKSLSASE